jgi:hypothetical protein
VVQSEPEYSDGWQVTVEPDGTIDGRYGYLFYEAEVPRRYTPAGGWSVAAGFEPRGDAETAGMRIPGTTAAEPALREGLAEATAVGRRSSPKSIGWSAVMHDTV